MWLKSGSAVSKGTPADMPGDVQTDLWQQCGGPYVLKRFIVATLDRLSSKHTLTLSQIAHKSS